MPTTIIGGLKIWFEPKDTERVLKTISRHSSRTDTLHMDKIRHTSDLCRLDFDLKSIEADIEDNRVHTGKYRLSDLGFNLDDGIKKLEEINDLVHVETDTGLPVYKEAEELVLLS